MAVLEAATNMQDQVLDAIKTGQDALLSAVKTVTENVAPLTEKLPAAPFADQMPDSVEAVNVLFGFAEKLLANQKEFTIKLIEAYGPAKPATKTTPKSAPKAA
jgi:hypothetical protein